MRVGLSRNETIVQNNPQTGVRMEQLCYPQNILTLRATQNEVENMVNFDMDQCLSSFFA